MLYDYFDNDNNLTTFLVAYFRIMLNLSHLVYPANKKAN